MLGSSELRTAAEGRIGEYLKDKWRLDALIGMGGTAAVYAATHRNGSRVAIKILHPHLSVYGNELRRFVREAYAANQVGHPGAVAVYDDDLEGKDAFLVMELLDGVNLSDHAEAHGGKLPVEEMLKLADKLLDVLKAAHVRGIIHRDIKPSNLFLLRTGALKVLDFGVARALLGPTDAQATVDGVVIGTPAFMAPEQARGQNRKVDARADVWSVGATLFTLLSGELLHPVSTASEHLSMTMSASARSFSNVRPDLPASLAAVIDRCLRHDPAERWPSASALQDALRTLDLSAADSTAALQDRVDSDLGAVSTATLSVSLASRPRSSKKRSVLAGLAGAGAAGLLVSTLLRDETPVHRLASLEFTSFSARASLGAVEAPLSAVVGQAPPVVASPPERGRVSIGKKVVQRKKPPADAARAKHHETPASSNPLDWRN